MDDYACAALDWTNVDARDCARRRTGLLREEIGRVKGIRRAGQRRMENARDTGRFKGCAELGPVRAVPTYNLVEGGERRHGEVCDAQEIDSRRCNRTSPRELNQRKDRGRRPDFGIAG